MWTPTTKLPLLLLTAVLGLGCGGEPEGAPTSGPPEASEPTVSDSAVSEPAVSEPDLGAEDVSTQGPRVIFLGDSLTAGYGLDEDQAFPALVAAELEARGYPIRMVNAGISGDTTAGGASRLDWLLRQEPEILVVALGANDGLRGVDLDASESHLRDILTRARDAGVDVLLAGMLIPPNYGPEYTETFAALFPKLAEEFDVPLIPFLLEGVAARPELNLDDGIHPNVEGQVRVAQTVLQHLEPLVVEASGGT